MFDDLMAYLTLLNLIETTRKTKLVFLKKNYTHKPNGHISTRILSHQKL